MDIWVEVGRFIEKFTGRTIHNGETDYDFSCLDEALVKDAEARDEFMRILEKDPVHQVPTFQNEAEKIAYAQQMLDIWMMCLTY